MLFISLGQGAVVHHGRISVIVKPMNAFLENNNGVCCASKTVVYSESHANIFYLDESIRLS